MPHFLVTRTLLNDIVAGTIKAAEHYPISGISSLSAVNSDGKRVTSKVPTKKRSNLDNVDEGHGVQMNPTNCYLERARGGTSECWSYFSLNSITRVHIDL